MNVSLFLSSLGLVRGGLETIAAGLARGLAEAGHQVTCVGGRWPRQAPFPDLAALPVRWLQLPCLPAHLIPARHPSLRARLLQLQSISFATSCRLSPASRRLMHETGVSLSLLEVETVLLSMWRAQQGKAHLSYFPGGIDWSWLQRDRSVVRVAISQTIADSYATRTNLQIDGVVTPGIEATLLQQPYDVRAHASRLLFTGRLESNKGVRELVQIFATLAPRFPDLTLTLLGDGPLRRELQATVAGTPWQERLILRGAVPPDVVQQSLREADLFLFPSHFESFGLAVMEAQLAGVPVVCNALPVMREVTGGTACLLPVQDQRQWVETIARLLGDVEARRRMSLRGREQARRFTWDRVVQALEPYLHLALQRCEARR